MSEKFTFESTMDGKISLRRFVAVALLISSALAWFLIVNIYSIRIFQFLGVEGFWYNVDLILFYGSGAFFAFVGSSISGKLKPRILLGFWILLGVLVSALMMLFNGVTASLFLSILLGFSIGFGFPSIGAFLADSTKSEERGRVSGLVILITFILTLLGSALITILGFGFFGIVVFCAILRSLGFASLIIDKCERITRKENSWKSVITHRNFILYLIPWLLFSIAADIWDWSLPGFSTARYIGVLISLVCMAFSGLIAGSFADRFGRRQPIVVALVIVGISFGLLAFAQNDLTIIVYYLVYGIAWGCFFALYFTIPGDLSPLLSKEKFYALSTIVPLTIFMGSSTVLNIFGIAAFSTWVLSPILSVIIFLSIIPVWRAIETLPGSKINERKMKQHLEKVGKLIKESKE